VECVSRLAAQGHRLCDLSALEGRPSFHDLRARFLLYDCGKLHTFEHC